MGYVTKEMAIGDDQLWIVLKHKLNKLGPAEVNAGFEGGKLKHDVLGRDDLEPYGICSDVIGSENAIFLSADQDRHGVLEDVFFYITKDGIPNSKFKVHVYNMNDQFMPGEELLDSTVILHAKKGNEWVKADLSSRHILIGRGVFISIEWLSGTGNNVNVITEKKGHEQIKYNTMVLAMTKGYSHEGSLNYQRGNFYHDWHHPDFEVPGSEHNLNPMIYATYTYYKR